MGPSRELVAFLEGSDGPLLDQTFNRKPANWPNTRFMPHGGPGGGLGVGPADGPDSAPDG